MQKMRKVSFGMLAVLTTCLFVTVASAVNVAYFKLTYVGDTAVTADTKISSTTGYFEADLDSSTYNSTVGLSLTKTTILGDTFISRCNKSTYGKSTVTCTYSNIDSGKKYYGTIVLNTRSDSQDLSGSMYVTKAS